jgi:hypothetical protein
MAKLRIRAFGLWCKSRCPIGYVGVLNWSRSSMGTAKAVAELFEGRHFDRMGRPSGKCRFIRRQECLSSCATRWEAEMPSHLRIDRGFTIGANQTQFWNWNWFGQAGPNKGPVIFRGEVIILCVRWYLRFKLSLRDLVEMMAERGLSMAHTTIMRWVQRYAPEFEKRWRRFARRRCGQRLPERRLTTAPCSRTCGRRRPPPRS